LSTATGSIETPFSTADTGRLDLEHVIHPLTRHRLLRETGPTVVVRAEGVELELIDGTRLIDGPAGMWCNSIGHGRGEIAAAAARQIEELGFSPLFAGMTHPRAVELAERLARLLPGDLNRMFFTCGGSEANETAIKLARYYWYVNGKPDKTVIISHERGYHGLTHAVTTATGLEPYHVGFGPSALDMERVPPPYPYRCVEYGGAPADDHGDCRTCSGRALEERIHELGSDRVAAVIFEPVLGSGGVIVPPDGYLSRVREACDRNGVLLICDEVITGLGRTGTWYAVERESVVPDFLTTAKGLTGGYAALGAVIARDEIWESIRDAAGDPALMHGFTYSGHPVACAVALATIDVIEREGLVQRAAENGQLLRERLEELRALPEVGEVRQRGLMAAVEIVVDRETRRRYPASELRGQKIALAARKRGVLMRSLLDDILFLSPPLIITPEQIERVVEAVEYGILSTR
jgi:adenosylmethionine-8-amino-7-oxononanoate aminotransferase